MFGKGYIPVDEVPQFCRLLLGEVEVSNSLQVQLGSEINDQNLFRPIDQVVIQFRPDPAQAPWAAKAGDDEPKSAIYKAFTPDASGHEYYERQIPSTWDSSDHDDLFMRSIIKNYALEGRSDDGLPTGKFYLNQAQFYKVGEEIVNTHLGFSGAQ